ncbi:MAG: patatin-like phospholipase family protein [Burkholderiales bacterium]|nr:patatin-like phospholipase family protein [Burkholderiales bacterium]MDE2609939.1 patatin-like phospholipase family protein [Burkholderiales bacterium]
MSRGVSRSLPVILACVLSACASTPRPTIAPQPLAQHVQPAAPAVMPPAAPRHLKIGLALGGGAARGFAHIGVIKALEAHGIHPDLIVGTSAGSVVGALYASGLSGLQLNRIAISMDEAAISDWALPFRSRGMLRGVALQDYVNHLLHSRPIERMPIPLGIVATDLQTGQPILFRRGNTGMAVRASSSVPTLFEPVRIAGHDYVDGGLVAPVPAEYARRMGADFVIAVDISAQPAAQATGNSLDVLLQTFAIMGQSIKRYELTQNADVVIRPALASMRADDFHARNQAILAGEAAVDHDWPEIERKLANAQGALNVAATRSNRLAQPQ